MKFSIRDILWLTILVAVAVTWWLDNRTSASRLEELQSQIQSERWARQLELGRRATYAAARARAQEAIQVANALVELETWCRAEREKLKELIETEPNSAPNGQWHYLH